MRADEIEVIGVRRPPRGADPGPGRRRPLRPGPTGARLRGASHLCCARCGLVYSRAAVAREMTLATGVDCRRCGGRLDPSYERPADRASIVAVRSGLSGDERVPSG